MSEMERDLEVARKWQCVMHDVSCQWDRDIDWDREKDRDIGTKT